MTYFPSLMIAGISHVRRSRRAAGQPFSTSRRTYAEPRGAVRERVVRGRADGEPHRDYRLTYGHASSGGGHKFVYKLDGSENHSTLMNIRSVARVSVDGDKLTISRVDTYPDGRVRENTQVWSINATGQSDH